ncbi:MAG: hypothetical protein HG439_003220 [candidate division SR1 bacterium]|nr:hypothetical protein [candidate division SR1 bacterium]
MKKVHYLLLAAVLPVAGLANSAFAGCQTISFTDGSSFCFDIAKTGTDTYRAEVSSSRVSSNSLSCKLTLPNNNRVDLPNCQGNFNYGGSDMKVELRAETPNAYSVLVANYDFRNGRFTDGSDSNNRDWNNNYWGYQVDFSSVSTNNPSTDQWIDMTLRVRNTSASYSNYFNGRVNFTVEEYRNGTWRTASSSDYSLERSSYDFSYSDAGERRLTNFLRFRNNGQYRILAQIDGTNYTAYQTFTVGNSNNNRWDNNRSSWVAIDDISTTSPSVDQWISLRVRRDGSYYSSQTVRFEVEEYRDGYWRSAYSSDYDLDRSSYTFYSSESSKSFSSFLKFRKDGEFRLTARLDNGETTTASFYVGRGRNNTTSSQIRVEKSGSSSVSAGSWVDLNLTAYQRYSNSKNENYNGELSVKVQKKDGYYWSTASSSDYDISSSYVNFYRSDYGRKYLTNFIRFRNNGQYKVIFTDRSDSSITDSIELSVGGSYYDNTWRQNNNNYNYTNAEYDKLRAVYNIWQGVISTLKRDYPRLRNSSFWQSESDRFYNNMRAVINGERNPTFDSWNRFYQGFMDWFSLTLRTR